MENLSAVPDERDRLVTGSRVPHMYQLVARAREPGSSIGRQAHKPRRALLRLPLGDQFTLRSSGAPSCRRNSR